MTSQTPMAAKSSVGFGPTDGAAVGIERYIEAVRVPLAEFIERHGQAFLLHSGSLQTPTAEISSRATLTLEPTQDSPTPAKLALRYDVLPVRKTLRSADKTDIMLGRAVVSDIVIPDPSVSHLHARFAIKGERLFSLTDVGSRNGTVVDSVRLEPHKPMLVQSGAQLRFGSAKFMLLGAREFCELVRVLAR